MYTSAIGAMPAACLQEPVRAKAQLALEGAKARAFGKTFAAAIFESLARTLWHAPALARVIEDWPGDLASAGVVFRLNAGVHAMARSGRFPLLHEIYRTASAASVPHPLQLDPAIAVALVDAEDDLLLWLTGPTQTNEVARVAGLVAALTELSATHPMPCALFELGASAGLNLNLAQYDVRMGTSRAGDPASPVRIAPRWSGCAPRSGSLQIARGVGVDLSPLDVTRPGDAERLHAYIWPGEHERSERLRAAIALTRTCPPVVEQGSAGAWLAHQLAAPLTDGERRVVFHSMALQYLPAAERLLIDRTLAAIGNSATPEQPLARVGLEWNEDRSAVEVRVTQWHGGPGSGRAILAARCHPYAEWFEWLGLDA